MRHIAELYGITTRQMAALALHRNSRRRCPWSFYSATIIGPEMLQHSRSFNILPRRWPRVAFMIIWAVASIVIRLIRAGSFLILKRCFTTTRCSRGFTSITINSPEMRLRDEWLKEHLTMSYAR